MPELFGNLLVAQSGGPTAAINASLAGVITEAGKHPDQIEEIYGSLNGILGLLNEDLVDLQEERQHAIEGLKYTPGAALGTCRYRIDFEKKPDQAARDLARFVDVVKAHNIRYLCHVGGNDSAETVKRVHDEAARQGHEIRIIAVPKTVDNDLPETDYCPGYGSVIKYCATTVREIGIDVASMATEEGTCCMIEVMGRDAGWIAAGTVLAKRQPADPPQIILVPEIHFNEPVFLAKVKETVDSLRYCVVVVAEGLKNAAGEQIAADKSRPDPFGHPFLSGAAEHLAQLAQAKLGLKTRTVKLGYAQRAAAHFASLADVECAFACGQAAVRAALEGKSGQMIKLVRLDNQPPQWTTDTHPLEHIANQERLLPRDWISEDGFLPNEKFVAYARPLVEGEIRPPIEGGLPKYVTLEKVRLEKKLPPR